MNDHGGEHQRLAAEQRARVLIDEQLRAAGWVVQDKKALNLFAGPGVAVRETVMAAGHGRADYLLYVDKAAVGRIEAKPEGTPLSGVEWKSAMYAEGLPAEVRLKALTVDGRLPFVFEASGDRDPLHQRMDIDAPWLSEGSGFRVNGLDVTPWVEQELDRRVPGRSERRAERPAGLQKAWISLAPTISRRVVARRWVRPRARRIRVHFTPKRKKQGYIFAESSATVERTAPA